MNAVTVRINTRSKFHSPLNRPIQRFSGRTLFKLTYSIPTRHEGSENNGKNVLNFTKQT